MALITNQTKRFEHPTEPGAWVELRPMRAGDMDLLTADEAGVRLTKDLLGAILTAWSYDEPPSRAAVDLLDIDTLIWLGNTLLPEIMEMSGIRSPAETQSLAAGSSPMLAPATEPSPPSSLISLTANGSESTA